MTELISGRGRIWPHSVRPQDLQSAIHRIPLPDMHIQVGLDSRDQDDSPWKSQSKMHTRLESRDRSQKPVFKKCNLNAWCNNILSDHAIFQSWRPLGRKPMTLTRTFHRLLEQMGKVITVPLSSSSSPECKWSTLTGRKINAWGSSKISGCDPGPSGSLGEYTSFWGERIELPTFHNVQSYCLLAAYVI